jgi:protein-disulfide isomerase
MSKLTVDVTSHDHIQGHPNAACSLVEYGDYECPSCGAAQLIIKRLQERFGTQLSFVFRNFPLQEIHPWAEPAAEIAEFADGQGRFWEMHDLLFANQASLGERTFQILLEHLGLSGVDLQVARSNGRAKKRIKDDFAGGVRSGVNGTPTFFLNGDRCDGPADYVALVSLIEQVIASDGE